MCDVWCKNSSFFHQIICIILCIGSVRNEVLYEKIELFKVHEGKQFLRLSVKILWYQNVLLKEIKPTKSGLLKVIV